MKMNEIMNTILRLSLSQGYYGRLYHSIRELECMNPNAYADLVADLEAQNFTDGIGIVLYFEC